MKKILTTIILAAGITICFAQGQQYPQRGGGPNHNPDYPQSGVNYNQPGFLVVSAVSQRRLSVAVDNYQYQSDDNTINIGQLNAGSHRIVVYQWRTNFWGRRVQDVVYNATLCLKQGFETTIFINSFGHVNINERQVYYNSNNTHDGYVYGRERDKHQRNHDHDDDDSRNNGWNQGDRRDRD